MPDKISMGRTRGLLAEARTIPTGEYFQALCQDTAVDLGIDKASVWTFSPDNSRIECLCSYDPATGGFSQGQVLARQDCPRYFRDIVEEAFVCAPDVATHPATREFHEIYFQPEGIVSLLDFILHDPVGPYGIICCEHRRAIRQWTEEDRNYLRSLAALTSFLFLSKRR